MRQVQIHIAGGAAALARLAAADELLDSEEQARAARFRFDADRCVVAAALPAPEGARFEVFVHDGGSRWPSAAPVAVPAATPALALAARTDGVELAPFQVLGDATAPH
ncbi:MAG: hypothetical protein LJE69_06870 [Thiohalocapsa sp.]|jgi:hypothetical protein|uniref:hypothetical protein n=1 Tax=Thiohalocapsa sp. TaxID=2497641 RepID=UPI0025CEE73D|nr:hypothetical protein [Thiohalocapsa sp.]MCG6940956.1 hypothetical protein [Thiohalocapsa sp.]